jgi:hypothetical protein
MTAVHEEVHSNAKQQWQPDQQSAAQDVHPVVVTQEKDANCQRNDQIDAGA